MTIDFSTMDLGRMTTCSSLNIIRVMPGVMVPSCLIPPLLNYVCCRSDRLRLTRHLSNGYNNWSVQFRIRSDWLYAWMKFGSEVENTFYGKFCTKYWLPKDEDSWQNQLWILPSSVCTISKVWWKIHNIASRFVQPPADAGLGVIQCCNLM